MNFKTSAIALAVAGSVATPMAAQADVYASVRIGVESFDTGGVSDLRTRSYGSRFGVRGETDLGNGMTGFGRYEWDVDFLDHNEDADDDIDIRHRYVGIKGGFGSLTIGHTYHTFYNHVVAPLDNPWWGSAEAYLNNDGREDHGVTYAGRSGDITFGATAFFEREAGEDAIDELEVGLSFGIGDMTLGIAAQTTETTHGSANNDDAIVGLALHGISAGDVSMGFGVMLQDEDTGLVADFAFGSAYLHIEQLSKDATDADELLLTLGYTQSLGRKTTAWYEVVSFDKDTGNSDDDETTLRAVLKYDIE